jgi:hypothetical protein
MKDEDIQVDLAFADKIASEQGNAVKKFSETRSNARIRLDWKYS